MIVLRSILAIIILSITYLSLSPKIGVDLGNDKIGHFIAYAALLFWALLSFHNSAWRVRIVLVVIVTVYGMLMELGQLFVPGRSFSYLDILANSLGAILGFILFIMLRKWVIRFLKKTGIIR